MNKLRRFTLAVACAAGASLTMAWAADPAPAAPESGAQPTEIQQLKTQLEQQQKQIEALRTTLEAQQKLLEKAASTAPADSEHIAPPNLGQVASTTPLIPQGVAPTAAAAQAQQPVPVDVNAQARSSLPVSASPLTIRIGDAATITPVGFVDVTNTFRSTNSGNSLATNFGNYPYNNNLPSGRLTEDKLSLQNSRIGFRVDTQYKDWHVLGYYEGDFVGGVGNAAYNVPVSSNSVIYRLRLFWVDVRNKKVEVLGGQSWSMMTPSRNHIGALPGDLFYGQEFDVNYLNGLTWGRIPGFRFLYRPSNQVTWGIAAENAEQYFGGSGGGGVPTLPTALTGLTSTEINNNTAGPNNGLGFPNVHPDIISKLAFDPSSRVHFEIGGVLDTVKIFNPNAPPALGARQYFTKTGGGGQVNANFELVKGFRLFTNNFWSDGAGRYMFGEAPNFIIRADGSPSPMHSGSTVDGFEWTAGKSLIYGYYGGIYVGRNTALDADGKTPIGYGWSGSPNSQNRTMQEGTIGLTQTLFRDPKYGQVSFYLDYAYFWRNPWYVNLAAGAPKSAHQNAIWFDLRYTLPGSAPAIQY